MVASFHDLPKVELNEAAQYYDRDSPGLGAAFVSEVERNPPPFSSIQKPVRS